MLIDVLRARRQTVVGLSLRDHPQVSQVIGRLLWKRLNGLMKSLSLSELVSYFHTVVLLISGLIRRNLTTAAVTTVKIETSN